MGPSQPGKAKLREIVSLLHIPFILVKSSCLFDGREFSTYPTAPGGHVALQSDGTFFPHLETFLTRGHACGLSDSLCGKLLLTNPREFKHSVFAVEASVRLGQ